MKKNRIILVPTILEARDLYKSYPEIKAVDGIGFKVERGTCYGLLGPNGAGKTTTMEMMEGIIKADAGEIYYEGEKVGASYKNEIGIQFQATSLQDFQTVGEALGMFAAFYETTADLKELIELCHLQEFIDRDTRKLSGGQRQRLLLAIALVNDPRLVFLDEPTTGLDPQSRRNFWSLIENIKHAGKTIVLTTHYMEEAYRLCDQIAIVDQGRIIIEGKPDELLKAHFVSSIIRLPGQKVGVLDQLPEDINVVDGVIEIHTDDVPASIARLETLGFGLSDCRISAPTLEDLFLKLTGHDLRS
jgi:ABC-2 type transport system ATP-binding protein